MLPTNCGLSAGNWTVKVCRSKSLLRMVHRKISTPSVQKDGGIVRHLLNETSNAVCRFVPVRVTMVAGNTLSGEALSTNFGEPVLGVMPVTLTGPGGD